METLQRDFAARKPRPTPKWKRVLGALIERPFLDRRIAAADPAIRDSVLNSTISELSKRGLFIERTIVRRPGYQGENAWLAEYRLPECERELAHRLLNQAGRRRGNG